MPFLRSRLLAKLLANTRVPRESTSRVIKGFLESIDCPRSLAVWLLYENKEFEQLVNLDVDPNCWIDQHSARDAYLATSFLSKFSGFPLEIDKSAAAYKKFDLFELRCKHTNRNFRVWRSQNWKNSEIGSLLSAMAFKIDTILGPFRAQEVFDNCDWGPGASTLVKSRDASKPHKFQYEIGITRRLYDLLCPDGSMTILRSYSERWSRHLIESGFPLFQSGNKVVTVPKSSKIDRVIAIEPGFNIWLQKGVGSVFRRRLRHRGIDLTDQSVNQKLALRASVDGSLATIDFSSASDSISYELVKEVFPPLWFELLDRLRCERGTIDGKSHTWEKFSSMGNGYTFEVETLIFLSLAYACADRMGIDYRDISVYGDDVIIPISIVDIFHRSSELLGFSFNTTKSYTTGPFRESCGAHWFNGSDFKPVYLKDRLNTVQSVYRLANAIRRLSHRSMCYRSCDTRFRRLFYLLVHLVPKPLRFMIPDGLGDGGFICNFDEATPRRSRNQIEGFDVKNVVDRSISADVDYDGLLLARLRELQDDSPTVLCRVNERWPNKILASFIINRLVLSERAERNSVSHRDHTRPVVMTSLAPSWYNLGPWAWG